MAVRDSPNPPPNAQSHQTQQENHPHQSAESQPQAAKEEEEIHLAAQSQGHEKEARSTSRAFLDPAGQALRELRPPAGRLEARERTCECDQTRPIEPHETLQPATALAAWKPKGFSNPSALHLPSLHVDVPFHGHGLYPPLDNLDGPKRPVAPKEMNQEEDHPTEQSHLHP